MSVISSYPQIPTTRNALTPRDVASYVTNPAYANDAALDTALTALTATVAALPTVTISASVPNIGTLGYFWLDSSTNNQLKICNATYGAGASDKPSKWTSIRDNTTLSVATAAQSTADTPSATTSSAYPSAYTQGWIWVNSSTGATYICKETYTAALSEGSRASKFTAMVDSATASIASAAAAAIANMGDDERIAPNEKLPLQREWAQVQTSKSSADTLATNWSLTSNSAYTAMVSAYNNLNTYLNTTITVFSDMSATTNLVTAGSTRSEWNNKWAAWYSTHGLFLDSANTTVRSSVVDMADDRKIVPGDKLLFQREWTQIQSNKTSLDSQAVSWSLTGNADYIAAASAYSALDTYLNTTLTLFTDMSTATDLVAKSSTRSAWNTAWANWYSKYTLAITAMTTAVKSAVDDMGDDEKITPSEKLALQREWTQIQNNKTNLDSQATSWSLTSNASYVAAVAAYSALDTYLNTTLTLFASMSTTTDLVGKGSTRSGWNTTWSNWYNRYTLANTAMTASVKSTLDDMGDDKKITPSEKLTLQREWAQIQNNKTNLDTQATSWSLTNDVEYLAAVTAYNALNTYLNTTLLLFASMTTSTDLVEKGSTRSAWNTTWTNWYDKYTLANASMMESVKSTIDDMGDDEKITPSEKLALQREWTQIQNSKTNLDSQATSWSLTSNASYVAAVAAYSTLNTYLNTTLLLFSSMSTTTDLVDSGSTRSEWNTTWSNWYSRYTLANTAMTASVKSTLEDMADDEKITPSEKLTLQREWAQIQNNKTNLDTQATSWSLTNDVEYLAAVTAYNALNTYLNTTLLLFASMTTSTDLVEKGSTRSAWDTTWTNWYDKYTLANSSMMESVKSTIDDMGDDEKITPSEKLALQREWMQIQNNKTNLDSQATSWALTDDASYLAAVTAYSTLNTYLNTTLLLFSSMSTTTDLVDGGSTRSEWNTTWSNWYSRYTLANTAMTASVKSTLDDMADDEKVTPSEKLISQREWAQIQNSKTNMDTQATNWSLTDDASYLAAVAAFETLNTYLNTTLLLFASMTTTTDLVDNGSSRNDWETTWANWYSQYTVANTAMMEAVRAMVDDMGDDGKIAPSEKLALQREWMQIQNNKTNLDSQATSWSLTEDASYVAAVAAYSTLNTYLNTTLLLFSSMPTVTDLVDNGSTRSEWNTTWSNWYSRYTLANTAMTASVKSTLADMADAKKITPSEKLILQREWAQIQNNKTNLDSQATNWSLTGDASYLAAVSAYNTLNTYLNTTLLLFASMSTATDLVAQGSSRNDWETKWTNWYNRHTLANTAMMESVRSTVDDMGDDEKITPSEKLVLQREWVQIQGNKTSMDALATDLALTGNSSYTAMVSAYTALDTYLNTTLLLFASMSTTTNLVSSGSNRTSWNSAWALWYSRSDTFAKTVATSLKADINLHQSDETITEAEARDYEVRWNYEVANHTSHDATITALESAGLTAKSSNVTWIAYDDAYDALNTYLNTTLNLFANTTWPFLLTGHGSSAADWRTKWEAYTDAERAMSALGSTTLAAQVDALGNDNVISQAEKRTVKAAWGVINGSLTSNPGSGEYYLLSTRAATLIAAGSTTLTPPKNLLDAAYTALYNYLITTLRGVTGIFDSSIDTAVDDNVWDGMWNGYYTAYANLDAATAAISDAGIGLINGLVEDETITAGKEKQDLIERFENIKTERTYLLAKAAAVTGVSTTAYTAAFSDLQTYLYGVFTNQAGFENQATGATGISRSLWASAFADYYEQREALEAQIIQTLNTNMSRDSAALPNMATDGTITSEEKYVAQQYWTTIYGTADNGEHDALRDQATNLGVLAANITAFNEAYNRLGNFIDTSNGTDYGTPYAGATALDLFADMGSSKSLTAAQQAEWQTVWNGYYTNRDAITLYITNALQTNLDGKLTRDGTLAMTGTLNMGGYQVSNLSAATATGQAVRYNEYNTFLGTTPIAASTANQIHALSEKATPVAADELLMEDSSASWAKKKVTASGIREYLGMPAGAVMPYAGSSAPTGWKMADGTKYKQADYAALFAVIGTTYNTGGEAGDEFRVPNLQNRVPVCKGSGTFASLAATGGAETHTLSTAELATHGHTFTGSAATSGAGSAHTHTVTDGGHIHQAKAYTSTGSNSTIQIINNTGGTTTGLMPATASATTGITLATEDAHTHSVTATGTIGDAGSGTAHNNLQPYIVLNYIIKT